MASPMTPVPLQDLALPADSKLLVLAPHPDDFDTVAVTLRFLFDRNHPILLLVLTATTAAVTMAGSSFLTPEEKLLPVPPPWRSYSSSASLASSRTAALSRIEWAFYRPR